MNSTMTGSFFDFLLLKNIMLMSPLGRQSPKKSFKVPIFFYPVAPPSQRLFYVIPTCAKRKGYACEVVIE